MRRRAGFGGSQEGGVAVTAACAGMMLCAMAALTVDIGSLALKAREVQGAADLAALAAAARLEDADVAAILTARANAGAAAATVVTLGAYAADRQISPATRFTPVANVAEANAARVEVSAQASLYFGRWILGRDSVTVTRRATAAARPMVKPAAAFSIGTRLAGVEGGMANALLSGLTGSEVSLSLMDYQALIKADVDLLTYVDALAAHLDVTAGDYDVLLTREIEAGAALEVLAGLLNGRAGASVGALADAVTGRTLKLDKLLGGAPEAIGAMKAQVRTLDLATAMLEVANGGRHVDLDVGVQAGLASVDVKLAIGERQNTSPWLTITDTGHPVVRTAQTRLMIRARTADVLAGLARVEVPVVIEAAASEARLAGLECDGSPSVSLDVRPGLARAWIGALDSGFDDFKTPLRVKRATLLAVPLVSISALADVNAGDAAWTRVRFGASELDGRKTKSVRATGALDNAISSLLRNLDPQVDIIGLGIGLGGLKGALGVLLAPIGPTLDAVVNPILDLLGVRLGEADVTVNGLRCPDDRPGSAALVS